MAKPTAPLNPNKSVRRGFFAAVLDGWSNILTGLGIRGMDKRVHSEITWFPMQEREAEWLAAGDDVASKIVSELPQEAFREGYELLTDGSPDENENITKYMEGMRVNHLAEEAWEWARKYGGSALIPMPEDLRDLAFPMPESGVDEVKNLLLLSRWELYWQKIDYDVRSKNFGHPLYYMIQPHGMMSNANAVSVHHSWVLRFEGAPLARTLFVQNNYWHDSVLTKTFNAIRNYNISHDAAALALQDFSVAVYKLRGLADMVADNDDAQVLARMQLVNATRSIARCVVIDAENEEYNTQSRTLTGVPDLLTKVNNRLVAASDMPHTKILGESPSGLGATGDSEEANWYDTVKAAQVKYADPKLKWLHEVIFKSKKGPTGGAIPKGYKREWKPLSQLTGEEDAKVKYANAQTDQLNVDMGVYAPEDVAKARYSGKYQSVVKAKSGDRPALPAPAKKAPTPGQAGEKQELATDPGKPGSGKNGSSSGRQRIPEDGGAA